MLWCTIGWTADLIPYPYLTSIAGVNTYLMQTYRFIASGKISADGFHEDTYWFTNFVNSLKSLIVWKFSICQTISRTVSQSSTEDVNNIWGSQMVNNIRKTLLHQFSNTWQEDYEEKRLRGTTDTFPTRSKQIRRDSEHRVAHDRKEISQTKSLSFIYSTGGVFSQNSRQVFGNDFIASLRKAAN